MNVKKISPGQAIKNLTTLGGCFGLGNLSDNFYKQCAILIAASSTAPHFQSAATVVYSLPFIFFSALAGWTADYYPKKYIVIGAKSIELLAFIFGAYMLVHQLWWGILLALFILGTQACFFSPALNGSIPETFPPHFIPRANSIIRLSSTLTLLTGAALAGVFLDLRPEDISLKGASAFLNNVFAVNTGVEYGRMLASLFTVFIATIGLILAFFLKKYSASKESFTGENIAFPKLGPVDSIKNLFAIRTNKELYAVLLAEAYFYGISILSVISTNNLAIYLHYSNTDASLFTALMMIGIAPGAIFSGSFSLTHWKKLVFSSGIAMSAFLFLISLTPLISQNASLWNLDIQAWWLGIFLFLCGASFGAYLIPLTSLIQVLPEKNKKGEILGISNFLSFIAIALFGIAFYPISELPAAYTFLVYAVLSLITSILLYKKGN